jgi:hypothetical protein
VQATLAEGEAMEIQIAGATRKMNAGTMLQADLGNAVHATTESEKL